MTTVIEGLNTPRRTRELTRSHFEFLAEIVRDDPKDRAVFNTVLYKVAPQIPLELLNAGLISKDPNIKGLFRPTELGKKILERYPTFYVLMRRQDVSFEQISTTITKGARRDR